MAIESETGFLSLADLAALQTDEIAVLTSRLPEPGIYTVRGTEVKASESIKEGEPPLFSFGFKAEVLEAKPLDKTKDAEKLIGRSLTERYTLWPTDFAEAIGLLKGRFQTVGLPNTGNLGGVEGAEPGWLDGFVNHVFQIRVRHFSTKSGDRAGYDWLKLPEAEGAEG